MTIRLRLTLWYTGLLTVALAMCGLLVYSVVYNNTMKGIQGQLREINKNTDIRLYGNFDLRGIIPSGLEADSIFIQLVSYAQTQAGTVQGKTDNMRPRPVPRREEITFSYPEQPRIDPKEPRMVKKRVGNNPFLVFEVPIVFDDAVIGLLQIGYHMKAESELLAQFRINLWLMGVGVLIVAFFLGMLLSRKALKPIDRVTAAAERIRSTGLGTRIPRDKPNDEIGRLTDTLNSMLAGLERAYNHLEDTNAAQRRFVSDASHELRTPLTTIRGNVDLLEKIWLDDAVATDERQTLSASEKRDMSLESIRDIADEARRMSRLVNDMLALARADAGYVVEMGALPLRPLAEEAARRASFLPRRAEWAVDSLAALDGIFVNGNRDYLLQLLFILIENGFKYTPSGRVSLRADRSGDFVGLTVADTGIGIAPQHIPHVFERFYRVDASRGETSGTGLGLAIAKWIADLHHARIEIKSREGEGTAITVWLPIAQA